MWVLSNSIASAAIELLRTHITLHLILKDNATVQTRGLT